MNARYFVPVVLILLSACQEPDSAAQPVANGQDTTKTLERKGTYVYDAEFLRKHTSRVLELKDQDGRAKVLLSADYQGRVMTSTATGDSGTSFGWLNYGLIGATAKKQQFNPVGGEERFWLGPEGGQYSIYFKAKDSFSFANWQVPAIIDTMGYDLASANDTSAIFVKTAKLNNYSGTIFDISIRRKISLLSKDAIKTALGSTFDPALSVVAYGTENSIQNAGKVSWNKNSGLLSIWLLAMLTPSDQTKVIIPFEKRRDPTQFITKDYFGPIPPERLTITDSFLVLNCDGKFRSKIGIAPAIARPIAASFDFAKNILTLIRFSVDRTGSYVNSKWEIQKQPYKGDAVNAYNDGPLADGTQMGPFYEIESSSPARELKPGETQRYVQTTFHIQGEYSKLASLAQQLLGVNLDEVKGLSTAVK